ncbi:MAG: hypothetical protein H7A45_18285 [Verrucomicrobiales bacterium]|nr:hypothetical protein [Verrucomicrobiales bacterium]MCP5526618.1 hypothetical protein [Verrucomicrobiales bacterium]
MRSLVCLGLPSSWWWQCLFWGQDDPATADGRQMRALMVVRGRHER